jgi:histidinol-phosphatase (PHP family)
MAMPADNHVHTEWSWDADRGSMESTCARAVELGVPAVAFTEHADWSRFLVREGELAAYPQLLGYTDQGVLTPPALDINGYLDCLDQCRHRYPGLRILSGVELGESHRHRDRADTLLRQGGFDRVLGSLHCLPIGDGFAEPPYLYGELPPDRVVRDYLEEIPRLLEGAPPFEVLAHLDYPFRAWPANSGPLDIQSFAEELRGALRAIAGSGRALEINTARRIEPELVRWWYDVGGDAVSFGSDAHEPLELARDLVDAAALAEACGFRPGRDVYDLWGR